jgi:alkanesulfonate monooxygenase SsuD/methylene tetrahydromethanopterin reductase-like flavin-dependent oxidoreductase (luciferase family)
MRPPAAAAWEARTLATLTDGRFLFGIGAGHPRIAADEAALRLPASTPGGRVAAVAETIRLVRAGGTPERPAPPVLVAATRPRMLTLAGREADVVAVGLAPTAGEDELAGAVSVVRAAAGDAGRECPELSNNLVAVGTRTAPWLARHLGADVATLAAGGSIAVLTGSVAEMAELLVRRRDSLGVSYVTVNAGFADALAPVVARLAGT